MTANEELAEKVESPLQGEPSAGIRRLHHIRTHHRRAGRTRRGRSHPHSDHLLRGRFPGSGRRESRGNPERRREAAAETGTPGAAGVVLRPGTRAFAPREDAGGNTVAGTVPGIQRTVTCTVWSRPSRRYGTCRHRTGTWFPAFCSAGADGDREPGVLRAPRFPSCRSESTGPHFPSHREGCDVRSPECTGPFRWSSTGSCQSGGHISRRL